VQIRRKAGNLDGKQLVRDLDRMFTELIPVRVSLSVTVCDCASHLQSHLDLYHSNMAPLLSLGMTLELISSI
jgi:hypothetical protein